MTLQIRQAGVWKEVQAAYVMTGGTLKRVVEIKGMAGGVLRSLAIFAPPLTVAISPSFASAVGNSGTLTTNAVTASPTGGQGPFTYAWSVVSYEGTLPVVNSPATATTTFRQSGLSLEEDNDCTFRVTVTDSLGTTATANVSALFYRTNFS